MVCSIQLGIRVIGPGNGTRFINRRILHSSRRPMSFCHNETERNLQGSGPDSVQFSECRIKNIRHGSNSLFRSVSKLSLFNLYGQ